MSKKKNTKSEIEQEENGAETPEMRDERQEEKKTEATLEQQIEELQDKYLRQVAEFENYRKRVIKEKSDLILNGGEKVLIEILPVIDDIERAKENINKANDLESIKEGIELIYNKFTSYLKSQGVLPIEAVGQPFNTEFHDAIAMIPSPTDDMKGKVIDCIQTGYKLHDKVIRHSKVAVAE